MLCYGAGTWLGHITHADPGKGLIALLDEDVVINRIDLGQMVRSMQIDGFNVS